MEFACHISESDLTHYTKQVFGSDYAIRAVTRLNGGAQKVVYKLHFQNGFACMLYVWDLTMNYFREEIEHSGTDMWSYGADFFGANNRLLTQLGIATPEMYDLNQQRQRYAFDYALVECIEGSKAEDYFAHPDTAEKQRLFRRIGEVVAKLHGYEREVPGRPDHIQPPLQSCQQQLVDNAVRQLDYAAPHMPEISAAQDRLMSVLLESSSRIHPRASYGLIHGELGPDHILVNSNMEPYLIDIEGITFFDIEHEHSFLEFRFGEHYRYFRHEHLDPDRMAFYRLHHHISLIGGGLKLLHRGFPDRRFAQGIVDHHLRCALQYVQ
ncbi:phosphotransferase family protein [Paenibacillus sp. XY044]|uniref:phosphotransferase family protein n=1 Tax=Paenibacillus sp. XY044 TaxID=2026089 RepID=UPI000B9844B8|nr:phosphotransferase [Paenibacillus sp. XY044]OZB98459.1 aminoglycoside phosphotransferase [Paenibacillus sp. XY044]